MTTRKDHVITISNTFKKLKSFILIRGANEI